MGSNAGDLAAVAERLRAVVSARRRFLRLWGVEQAVIHPALDRVAADVERAQGAGDGLAGLGARDDPRRSTDDGRTGWGG